jgi:hypothetical protein
MVCKLGRTGRLSEENDSLGVSTKCSNVISDPFYGQSLVQKSGIQVGQKSSLRESKDVDSVAGRSAVVTASRVTLLYADNNDVLIVGKTGAVVRRRL